MLRIGHDGESDIPNFLRLSASVEHSTCNMIIIVVLILQIDIKGKGMQTYVLNDLCETDPRSTTDINI